MSKQFVMFLLTGGFAAVVNFGSRILYSRWTNFTVAVVLAYVTGMVTAFVLNKLFVFTDSTQSVRRSALLFTIVNVFGAAQTLLVSLALAYYVLPRMGIGWHVDEIAHAVGVAVPVFTSYLGHKHWSFR